LGIIHLANAHWFKSKAQRQESFAVLGMMPLSLFSVLGLRDSEMGDANDSGAYRLSRPAFAPGKIRSQVTPPLVAQ
jgi:hypothetical protein